MIYQATILAILVLAAVLLLVPRKYILLPFILGACFIPADQRVIIMDLDFTALRILVLLGFLRIFVTGKNYGLKLNNFDRMVFAWAICGAIIYCIQWGDTKAFIHQSGMLFDVFGLYLIFRKSINSWDGVRLALKIFAACSLFMAVLVGCEWTTGQNPFAVLGKVHTVVRAGRYRCEASFPHSIMSGLFWGMLMPLFVALAVIEKKKLYWSAVVASVFIVVASASSTPLLALAAVLLGLLAFRWRRYVSRAALCLLVLLCALHIVMNAPVWHLLSRVDVIGGSAGWHRYNLIEQAVRHFGEWVLIGTRSTEHWGWGMQDLTNHYVYEGVRGGIITLVVFLAMLCFAFKITLNGSLQGGSWEQRWFSWCFFVSLIGHCAAFFAVAYFGQITMLWYMTLAMVGFFAQHRAGSEQIAANMLQHAYVTKLANLSRE